MTSTDAEIHYFNNNITGSCDSYKTLTTLVGIDKFNMIVSFHCAQRRFF